MTPFHQSYAKQLFDNYRLYAMFPPVKTAVIGDIGTLEGKLYQRRDNLKDLTNLTFKERTGEPDGSMPEVKSHMNFSTKESTEIKFLAKGEADLINAGMEVQLKNENSFYFNLAGVEIDEIENQLTLEQQILQLYKEDKWKKEWVVVTAVIRAQSSLIFGSSTGNSSITLEAKTDIPNIQLDNAAITLGIKHMKSVEMNFVDNDLTPLVVLARIHRKSLFGSRSFGMSGKREVSDDVLIDKIREHESLNIDEYFELKSI